MTDGNNIDRTPIPVQVMGNNLLSPIYTPPLKLGEEEEREDSFPSKYIATAFLWSDTPSLPICFLAVLCPHLRSSGSCTDPFLVWFPSMEPLNKFITAFPLPSHRATPNCYHIGGSPFLGLRPCGLPSNKTQMGANPMSQ